jgi:PST family polysaccharide transporter
MIATWTRYLTAFVRRRIDSRQNLQNILSNTGWLFADKILRMGIGVFVGVWVARYLGPDRFGLFSYATAFVTLFATFATLGLDGIVVRDIVRFPECREEILGTSFLLKLVGGITTLTILVGSVMLFRPGNSLIAWLVGIVAAGTVFQAFDVIDFWFQSQLFAKYTVMARNMAFLLMAMVKIVLIYFKAQLIAFALAGLAEIIIGTAGLVIFYSRTGQNMGKWGWSRIWARKLLKDSWPLILTGAVIAIYMKIDQIMLGSMIGNRSVGLYSAAVQISEIWYFIPGAIVASVYPSLIKARQESITVYYERMQQLYTLLIWLALCIAIPLTFLSSFVVTQLFGEGYAESGPVLSIHIWIALFTFYGVGKSAYIQCENMQMFSVICTSTGALLNVLLNLVLIKKFGIVGAALATLCAQITAAVIIPSLYRRDRVSVFMFFRSFVQLSKLWRVASHG